MIPRDQMTVCCGTSGIGQKLAGHGHHLCRGPAALCRKPQRLRPAVRRPDAKAQLDHIEGLSPAIAIEQKHIGHTPRSTVGTVTEIYDYMRILVSRLGQPYCPDCDMPIGTQIGRRDHRQDPGQPAGTKLYLMAPLEIHVGDKYETLWEEIRGGRLCPHARRRTDALGR